MEFHEAIINLKFREHAKFLFRLQIAFQRCSYAADPQLISKDLPLLVRAAIFKCGVLVRLEELLFFMPNRVNVVSLGS
jgi:hypothetical protein